MRTLNHRVKFVLQLTLVSAFLTTLSIPAGLRAEETPGAERPPLAEGQGDPLHVLKQGVRKITLSNGMRVVIFRRSQAPVFAGEVWVKVGGVNELPGGTGISHFLEHMAFKGTETVGTEDYAREKVLLEEVDSLMAKRAQAGSTPDADTERRLTEIHKELEGLWVDNEFSKIYQRQGGVGLNAATSKDFTYYTVDLPSAAFDLWCWMESERLIRPVFRQFYKEREVVLEERRRSYDDNPEGLAYEALLGVAYLAHSYRLPLIGWPDDVRSITRDEVIRLHQTFYRPDNIVIGLVGDLDPEAIRPKLEAYFGRLAPRTDPLPPVEPAEPRQRGEREVTIEFDAEPSLIMAYHKPVYPNKDDLYFSVLHSVLSDSRSSILYKELVEQKKLAAAVSTQEAPGERFPSLFLVSAVPAHGVSYEKLRDAIQAILDRLKTQAVSDAEIVAAKKRVKVGLLNSLNSNSGLSTLLAKSELFWNDWTVLFKMYETVNETTADDLKRLASSYLNVENRTSAEIRKKDRGAAVTKTASSNRTKRQDETKSK